MGKLIFILAVFSVFGVMYGCAEAPKQTGNSAEVQRAHAEQAQRELSSDVKK